MSAALDWLHSNRSASLDRLIDWLRIPSIGTDSAHDADTTRAAEWARGHLAASGFDAELVIPEDPERGTKGHPIVVATSPGAADYRGPHVLFYGHYDVQPVDPVDLWESGPFEPVIRPAEGEMGERVVARGACDDKGQVASFLEAMRAVHEATGIAGGGVRYTVVLEGEEESGSVHLPAFVRAHRDQLAECDVCVISDTGMLGRGRPAITYGLRGLAYAEVTLHGPDQDLHSGLWGGRTMNPNNELVRILGGLWDEHRRVTLPGFYERVQELSEEERQAWKRLDIDPARSLRSIGLPPEADAGEAGYSFVEREWARPTCDVNGIIGGYTGEGAKTVIPSHASAKVSFRLVADQDPDAVMESFFAWCNERTPPGFRWEFESHGRGHPATVPTDSEALRAARRAIAAAGGAEPALIKTGGSIPVAGLLKQELGIDTIFMGFGLEDDRVHSPNEKFELECFDLGARSHALLVDELLRLGR